MSIRLLLADDHKIMTDALGAILADQADFEVVGQACTGDQTLELVAQLCPDVVALDIGMPGLNGVTVTRRITAKHPGVKVVALSAHSDRRYVRDMLRAGAGAYVTKASAATDLVHALRAVMQGRQYLSPGLDGAPTDPATGRKSPKRPPARLRLSPREVQVLKLLVQGRTSGQIATQLNLSARTAETHRRNITQKLDLHGIAELTKYALREGLAEP
jgi:two-component system NarL family response regulator